MTENERDALGLASVALKMVLGYMSPYQPNISRAAREALQAIEELELPSKPDAETNDEMAPHGRIGVALDFDIPGCRTQVSDLVFVTIELADSPKAFASYMRDRLAELVRQYIELRGAAKGLGE